MPARSLNRRSLPSKLRNAQVFLTVALAAHFFLALACAKTRRTTPIAFIATSGRLNTRCAKRDRIVGVSTPRHAVATSTEQDLASSAMSDRDPMLQMASMLLPEQERRGIWALYSWCRRADNICDAPEPARSPEERSALLSEIEADFMRLRQGGPATNAIDEEIKVVLKQWPSMEDEPFVDMLSGMRTELQQSRFPSFEPDLRTFAYCVAGTVGLMLLPVLGVTQPTKEVKAGALDLGIAIQLTNILRDVGEDARNGMIYIPQEDLKAFGVSEEDILASRTSPQYKKLTEFQIERARGYFDSARKSVPDLPFKSRLLVLAVIRLLSSLLDEVLARDCNNLTEKVKLSTLKKVLCLFGAIKDWIALELFGAV